MIKHAAIQIDRVEHERKNSDKIIDYDDKKDLNTTTAILKNNSRL